MFMLSDAIGWRLDEEGRVVEGAPLQQSWYAYLLVPESWKLLQVTPRT